MRREDDDYMLEKAFKEGCEHGYRKAMREAGFDERGGYSRGNYREGFEEKLKNSEKSISNHGSQAAVQDKEV